MELIFITHHSILNLHVFPPLISWILVIGAVWGAAMLLVDIVKLFGRIGSWLDEVRK
jgi:hypothetical protein